MTFDKESVKTGIPVIDSQHAAYFAAAEKVLGLCETGGARVSEIREILAEAQNYAIENFDTEERMMEMENYPHLDTHRRKHDTFRSKMDALTSELDEGADLGDLAVSLARWMITWFVNQVQTDDMQMAAFHHKR